MRPNAAKMAMARLAARFFGLLVLVVTTAIPAWAGDRAALNIIGYSTDGRYFAFEEYGVQDGSGFAYANGFVIDLTTDQWVKGMPIRVQADTEERPIQSVRAEVLGKLQRYIARFDITHPADLIAMIGDGIADDDGTALDFGAIGFMGPGSTQGEYHLKLDTFDIAANDTCRPFEGDPLRGFALSLTSVDGTVELHRDTILPASRRCTLTYRLYGVAVPFPGWSIEGGVAIVSAYSYGFEGPDRRFLVVPLGH